MATNVIFRVFLINIAVTLWLLKGDRLAAQSWKSFSYPQNNYNSGSSNESFPSPPGKPRTRTKASLDGLAARLLLKIPISAKLHFVMEETPFHQGRTVTTTPLLLIWLQLLVLNDTAWIGIHNLSGLIQYSTEPWGNSMWHAMPCHAMPSQGGSLQTKHYMGVKLLSPNQPSELLPLLLLSLCLTKLAANGIKKEGKSSIVVFCP